jgi:hypothetical protein
MATLVHREMRSYDNSMAIYTIHKPPLGDMEQSRFIREGVNFFALVVPLIWLVWHRLWLALLAYVAVMIAIGLAGRVMGGVGAILLSALPGLYLFVEGNELLRNRLSRSGYTLADVVEGDNVRDAEIRYFTDAVPVAAERDSAPSAKPEALVPKSAAPHRQPRDTSGIGIFPE